jgi:AcrR family transcriptional regulator
VARTLNPRTHAVRRDAFVSAALRLLRDKGWEQVSVQEVIESVGASKGAFYHYFDSRAALLEAAIETMSDAALASLQPVIAGDDRTALQKLEGVFGGLARWKGERSDMLVHLLRSWLADENALVREHFRRQTRTRLTPVLAAIVAQGRREGAFTTDGEPEDLAHVLFALLLGANEEATDLYFARQAGAVTFDEVDRRLTAFGDAFDRVLGLPAGSFPIADRRTLEQWFG